MMNINLDGQFPPDIPHSDELHRYGDLYAGRTSGHRTDILNPDPELARSFTVHDKERKQVRSNIVADIASSIASLEIGEHVDVTTGNDTVDAALALTGLDNTLLAIAEEKSVFGGCFVRINYQPDYDEVPQLVVTAPTSVAPVFRGGTLVSATFWQTVKTSGTNVWRWVEHRDNQQRTIMNRLYKGNSVSWGEEQALDSIAETRGLDPDSTYPNNITQLVFYVPNLLPNRRHPDSQQGRSDIAGSESQIAALDTIYTSLVRDFRLGRARIVVPVDALKRDPNLGATFDQDREVYTTLDIDPTSDAGRPAILQGAIRSQEHLDTIRDLIGRVVSSAGFAPASFGLGDFGTAQSGTALRVREGKTISTIQAKRRYVTPEIIKMVRVFAQLLGETVDTVNVEWGAIHQEAGNDLAQMLNTLTAAGAMSTVQAVETLHPDWGNAQVEEEVLRIQGDAGQAVTTPTQF